jgi:acyl-coenzyme A thioesterase PaaI-like protein
MGDPKVLGLYKQITRLPFGRELFSQIFRWAAPYFRSIPAHIESAEPGCVVVRMEDRFRVHNHLGTVHAIAICNLAELTMGLTAEITLPTTHRWIPKGMTVEYLAKAKGTMRATAKLELPKKLEDKCEIAVPVSVTDPQGQEVVAASIRIWVTRKRESAA